MQLLRAGLVVVCIWLAACGGNPDAPDKKFVPDIMHALDQLGLDDYALTLPKLPRPLSTPARLPAVDHAMRKPLSMVTRSYYFAFEKENGSLADYLSRLLNSLDTRITDTTPGNRESSLHASQEMPADWPEDSAFFRTLHELYQALAIAKKEHQLAVGNPTDREWLAIKDHLAAMVHSRSSSPDAYRLNAIEYHQYGARLKVGALANSLLTLLGVVEKNVYVMKDTTAITLPMEWETPLGTIRIAGAGNDLHSGDYLLLIDTGGDDHYKDIGRAILPGQVSLVIDLAGNDLVTWDRSPGPGGGVLGTSVWVDLSGNDRYVGNSLGMGAGLFGAGLLWDESGNDTYQGVSKTLGAGQYGIGIMLDRGGEDQYTANIHSQGFGGTGGFGMQIDTAGNDLYTCAPLVEDQSQPRRQRHKETHYINLCQGFGAGNRPDISGGVGILLDREGDDQYRGDLFVQGASFWFGLGMLIDAAGQDSYQAYEHCQGGSLHMGAGFLTDWDGNDHYSGFEHCQGVGVDRAVGLLFDQAGNDLYEANNQSQGAGIKPYGAGLLIDQDGNDAYHTNNTSQGYAARPPENFPESQWPVGLLLDLGGKDQFTQPNVASPKSQGRIFNRQGIAVDR